MLIPPASAHSYQHAGLKGERKNETSELSNINWSGKPCRGGQRPITEFVIKYTIEAPEFVIGLPRCSLTSVMHPGIESGPETNQSGWIG